MQTISLGPLALPLGPLLLVLCGWGATRLAVRLAGEAQAVAAADAVFQAVVAGLVAARLMHVLLAASAYRAAPLDIADLRDGGWNLAAGWAAGLAWLAWRAGRSPSLRRALAGAAAAGALAWFGGSTLLGRYELPAVPRELPLAALADGAPVTLAQQSRGRPMVVNLWASWCGPCRQEMPVLVAAQQRAPDVAFVFVNQGEGGEAVQRWLAAQPLAPREVLLDPGSRLGPAVGSQALPTTLFVAADGRTVDAHFGVLSGASLEARLRRLRSGAAPG